MRHAILVSVLAAVAVSTALAQVGFYAPHIELQPRDAAIPAGATAQLDIVVNSLPGAALQWRKNGSAISGATASTLEIRNAQPDDSGRYDCVATGIRDVVTSRTASLIVAGAPVTLIPPASATEPAGARVRFSITAVGVAPLSYQWRKSGVEIPGATLPDLPVIVGGEADTGTYDCVVLNALGSVTSQGATLSLGPSCMLTNLSVRANRAAGNVIVGFASNGGRANGAKTSLLIRAVGPTLAAFGLPGDAAPSFELVSGSASLGITTGWSAALAPTFAAAGAFPLPPDSRDAATVQAVDFGTIVVSGGGFSPQPSGTVLVELYALKPAPLARLVNLSARAWAGSGAAALVAGFTVSGGGTKTLLLRGIGPGLASFGVFTIVRPELELFDGAGHALAETSEWNLDLAPTFQAVGAFPLESGSGDAAMIVTLQAGSSYTARVSPKSPGYAGEAMIEIYELP